MSSRVTQEDNNTTNHWSLDEMDKFLSGVEQSAYRIAKVALADHDEALDVVQDSMIRLVRRYQERPVAEWRPLFYTILHNRITDSHRRNTWRRKWFGWFDNNFDNNADADGLPDPVERVASGYLQPQQQLGYTAALSEVETTVGALPLRQQQAFMLRMVEGMDTRTTAEIMGCSTGSVKTHLSRALGVLKTNLEDHYEPGD